MTNLSSNCHRVDTLSSVARILVVDDEPKIVSFVARSLEAEGFSVEGTSDSRRGLRLAESGDYDLVILDLLMDSPDGVSVLRRTMESQPGQKVLILSALSDTETKVRCLGLGASDYLTKPFDLAELAARVRARLRDASEVPAERVLRAGRLSLDLQRREADTGRGPVSLSTREFLLLEHLMRRAGDVCTRDQLLAKVWGYSFDPGTNVVDVYVGRLRAKLASEVIETVRNVGYALRAP